MEELLYGAAYYLEYMPYDRIEEDIAMMKKAGMNTVRIAESTWSTWEPEDGVFDFTLLTRMLDAFQKAGMMVIVGTPTYAIPSWMAKKDPSVMGTRSDGTYAPYGARQIMDIVNPTFRFHCERIIRKMMEVVQPYDNVIGFQLDNETKHYDTYSAYMQKMFVEYLKSKYDTCENLNHTFGLAYWSNSISDFADFPDIRGTIHGGLKAEFDSFRRSVAAHYLMWQKAIVEEYKKPEQFITHNFDFDWRMYTKGPAPDGYSYGVQGGINHYEASQAVTVAGVDIYHPSQDELTGAEIAFGGDEMRSLKQAPYLVLETQAQAFKNWTPYPGQLRLQAISHLASGAKAVMYWNWHSIHNSFETYWKGVLSHDFAENDTYLEACSIGKEMQSLSAKLAGFHKENKIAILTDNRSMDALRSFPIDQHICYNDVVRAYFDTLYRLNLECDVIDVAAFNERDDLPYQMIVAPALYVASEQTIAKLRTFVEKGGTLVTSFKSFVASETLTVYHDMLPHGLTDVFGMTYNQYSEARTTKLGGEPISYYLELLKPTTGTTKLTYEHRYWNRYAGVVSHPFGKGNALYIGAMCAPKVLTNLLFEVAMEAGVVPAFMQGVEVTQTTATTGFGFPVIVRSGMLADGSKVHFVMNYSENHVEVSSPWVGEELLGEGTYEKGQKLSLKDWDVKIIRETM